MTGGKDADAALFSLDVRAAAISTNDIIKQAIEDGAPEGTAVRAVRQAGGYGRQGRSWSSPEGGMYLSVLLRPDVPLHELPTLSLAVGLAVRSALASLVTSDQARRIAVKWPNDVVVLAERDGGAETDAAAGSGDLTGMGSGDPTDAGCAAIGCGPAAPFDKICGISLERHRDAVCVGIGVNVLPPSPDEAAAVSDAAQPAEQGVEQGADAQQCAQGTNAQGADARQDAQGADAQPVERFVAAQDAGAQQRAQGADARQDVQQCAQGSTPPAPAKNAPAYLSDLGFGFICDRQACVDEVARAVLEQLGAYYRRWQSGSFAPMAPEYARENALRDMTVAVSPMAGAAVVEGRVVGVDENGRLLIETAPETVVGVSSGEAHILKRG